ncbi:HAD family hydrolase [Marivibrio halodurans]|nr:HAD-IA family hydrolase [Marivibrio halodurans]
MLPSGFDAILFDKDGTLLDYHATWMPANRAVVDVLAEGDAELARYLLIRGGWDPESDRVAAGSPLAAGALDEIVACWADLLPPGRADDPKALEAEIDRLFIAHCEPTAVCDLAPLLDGLRGRGLRLGVATADSEAGARASLGRFDILDRFDFLAGYDSGHGCKPAPGQVAAFCAATGLPPARVMVIGDNAHDIEMARAAGAGAAVGVLTGTTPRAALEVMADAVFEDIRFLAA